MLIICRLEQSANSSGKLCRFGLSLTYNDSRDSSVPTQHMSTYIQQDHGLCQSVIMENSSDLRWLRESG